MKWHFFTDKNRNDFKVSEHLAVYILSLFDPKTRFIVSLANKNWFHFVQLTERYVHLLPTIQSIPMFSQVTLDVLRLKLMTGGMTNTTYQVKVGPNHGKSLAQIPGIDPKLVERNLRKKWVVRFPGDVSLFSVDRRHEKNNALQASELGLNVSIAYFNEGSGVQVTEFIEDVQIIDEQLLQREGMLVTLAGKARALHTSSRFLNDTAVFERNEGLLSALSKKNFVFPDEVNAIIVKMDYLKCLFSSYGIEMCPCHNDSTPLNYLLSYKGKEKEEIIYQIDWEYSSNNDFLWDLAYFAIEAKLTSEQERTYLTAYFGKDKLNQSMWAWYTVYKPVVEWWITLWSWTQIAAGASAVDVSEYVNLGQERFEKTLMHINSAAFKEAEVVIEDARQPNVALNQRSF